MTDLLETRDGAIVTLTINRPEAMNALSIALFHGLIEAFERLGQDPEVGVIILAGAGRAFCAGGDVKSMAALAELGYEERVEGLRWKQRIPFLMRTCPKVIVAAVHGPALGAGFALALAADFRIVARSATFRTAFAGVAYSGDFGCSWTLTRLVGTAKARELMMLNPRLTADEVDRLGLVTRLVEDEMLVEEVSNFARKLAEGPRITWGYMKRNLHAAETEPLAAVLEIEAQSQVRCATTADHKEAVLAWSEKRPPVFLGR